MMDDDDRSVRTFFDDLEWILARAYVDAAVYLRTHSPRTLSDQEIQRLAPHYMWRAVDELTADLDEFDYRGRMALLTEIIERQRELIDADLEREGF